MQSELQYLEQDVKFFQLWALTADLGLDSTLFSILGSNREETALHKLIITAPTTKISQSMRLQGPRIIKDSFIVSNGAENGSPFARDPGDSLWHNKLSPVRDQEQDDLHFRLNWKTVFQYVFGLKNLQDENFDESLESAEKVPAIEELLDRISSHIQEGMSDEKLRSSTL
jgi:RNA polymerase I-specific transcription initiation factor RRN6